MTTPAPGDTAWSPDEEPPLTARSVIASTLLGVHPPRLPTGLLVGSCGLFGVAEGTARVAISRMVAAGDLEADDSGYALGAALRRRQARQDLSRRGEVRPWDPGVDPWRTAVVTTGSRAASERAALRRAAVALRLAELREGVWLRPDNLPAADPSEAAAVVAGQCRWLASHPEGDPVALAAELWDLAGWAERARRLLAALEGTRDGLDRGRRDELPAAFVLSAAVLRHLQADPLLPAALLPDGWPGADLRATYEGWDAAFAEVWRSWYRAAQGHAPTA